MIPLKQTSRSLLWKTGRKWWPRQTLVCLLFGGVRVSNVDHSWNTSTLDALLFSLEPDATAAFTAVNPVGIDSFDFCDPQET